VGVTLGGTGDGVKVGVTVGTGVEVDAA